jgi:hypothetical protein
VVYLKHEYTLPKFVEIISNSLNMAGISSILEDFYVLSAYHVGDKLFKDTRELMDLYEKEYLPRLYHGSVMDLLPLQQISLA